MPCLKPGFCRGWGSSERRQLLISSGRLGYTKIQYVGILIALQLPRKTRSMLYLTSQQSFVARQLLSWTSVLHCICCSKFCGIDFPPNLKVTLIMETQNFEPFYQYKLFILVKSEAWSSHFRFLTLIRMKSKLSLN